MKSARILLPLRVASPFRQRKGGFALLITITLLSFLILLLVSLASLTRVETQVAANSQQLGQARQNALMALNIALGQLQKTAGPDQRVTARADVLTTYSSSPASTDAESSATYVNFWKSRSRSWTGVWGNAASSIGYGLTPSQITGSGTTPALLGWLVSGNEGGTFTLGGSGQTTAPSAPKFTPDLQVAGLTSGLNPLTATLTFPLANTAAGTSTTEGVLLVGPASTSGGAASDLAQNYVVAPLVDLQVPANQVSGLSGTTGTTIGRYAYWVGDEGVKARMDLRDSYLQQTTSANQTAYQINSFITAQRSAVEMVDYDSANTKQLLDYPAPSASAPVGKLMTVGQLSFLGGTATAQTNLLSATKSRFHDLTSASYGVLADTYAGGLKKDLTADIADTTAGAVGNRPADSAPIFPKNNASDHVPTWGQLRAFPRTNPSGGGLTPSLPTTTAPGMYPVINLACLGFDFFLDTSNRLQVAMFPCVVLWNPYSTTIKAANYELGFRIHNGGQILLQTAPAAAGPFTTVATLNLSTGELYSGSGAGSAGFVRFPVQCQDIPPGECHLYRLNSVGAAYSAGSNLMTRAPSSGSLGVTNYVTWTIPSLSMSAATVSTNYFKAIISGPAGTGISTGTDALVAVLGQPNTVTGITSTTGWYQAVLDAHPGKLGSTVKVIIALSGMPPAPGGSSSALRLIAPMELRGGFNSNANWIGSLGPGRQRWLVMSDVRAPIVRNSSLENVNTRGNTLFGAMFELDDFAGTGWGILFPYEGRTVGYLTGIGGNQEAYAASYAPSILFDVPASSDRLLSIGQFQNAHLGFYGFQGSYLFGNSWADVRIPRAQHYIKDASHYVYPDFGTAAAETLYDLSWHLNRALWDKYFVSGVPSTWTAADVTAERALPDARMTYVRRNGATPALSDIQYSSGTNNAYDRAAANLLVKGAFNINSTSEQAWRALLAGTYQLPANTAYADAGDNVGTIAPIPRFSGNLSQSSRPSTSTNTMKTTPIYLGNRGLLLTGTTPASTVPNIVNELARTIVNEVRTRGPFLSLADFVNRRVAAGDTGIRGALQAAIDKMTGGTGAEVNPTSWTGLTITTSEKPVGSWDSEHFIGGATTDAVTGYRTRFAGAPKFLTQADLLSTLGPALSARSDTFRIRTYGDVKNPVTGKITSRAWCEAIVQRTPDYMNTADVAETAPASLADANNKTLGRRFIIVGFRWLTPSEI
jgi:hypothetical protein